MGRRPTRLRRVVIVLSGLSFAIAAAFGVAGAFSGGDISGTLAAEPLTEPLAPMRHTVILLKNSDSIMRHGIQGNRQFFVFGTDTTGDELSVYDKGTFTSVSRLESGAKVRIRGRSNPGYFLAHGHVLGWQVGDDTWAVLRSRSPGDAKERLLNLAANVVSGSYVPFRAPFSMSYAPPGFIPTHASRRHVARDGEWEFGLSKGGVPEQAPLTVATLYREEPEDTQMVRSLGEPDSQLHARQMWRVKAGTPGFSVPPGGAEIVLRRDDGCFGHIRIADVSLIPAAEQEKIVNGIILGLCLDTRGWAYPFAELKGS